MKRVGLTIWLLLLAVSTNLYDVEGRSTGPPADEPSNFDLVCNQMTPNSINHGPPMGGNGGYFIDISPSMTEVAGGFTYVGGQIYTIRVVGTGGSTFRGFLVQARAPNNPPPAAPMLLGSFQTGAGNQRTLDCDAVGASATAAIGHSTNLGGVGSVEFSWVAPSTGGTVDFHYTVVRTRTTHFDAMSAKAEGLFVAPTTGITDAPTDMTGTTMPPTTQSPTTLAPGNPIVPQRSPEDYRLIFSNPEGCNISDCDHFIGIDTNAGDSNYLDIYMEGDAAGWVAVGFSETSDMFLADVVACNRVDDTITALDNKNMNGRDSLTDALQDVTLFNSSFVDGRITCTVAKRIAPSDDFDLDLDRNLFVIYARRIATSVGLTKLNTHSGGGIAVRGMSAEQVNPAQTGGTVGGSEFDRVTRPRLIRAHGALMIIAWPMLGVMGIFFAVFMRPAMPSGGWFQAHRALLIISEIVATVGFILIFVALKDRGGVVDLSNSTSVAHLVIGVIVMALHITNPIIAIFRCKPDGEHRWIYNLLHGAIVGTFAEILALINIALGIYLFTGPLNLSRYGDTLTPFWLYISWDAFYVALIVVLFVVFTISAFISSDKDRKQLAPSITRCLIPSSGKSSDSEDINNQGTELTTKVAPDNSEKEEAPETSNKCDRKRPSKDSCYRWVAFGVFSAVTNTVLTALIVLIARAQ